MDSFFGKSGTLQSLMGFAKDYSENENAQKAVNAFSGLKSGSGLERLSSIVKMISSLMALG